MGIEMEKKLTDDEWFEQYAKNARSLEEAYSEQLSWGGTADDAVEMEIEYDRRLIAYVRHLQEEIERLTKEEWRNLNKNYEILKLELKEARKETVEKFAERVKMSFYYEFDELIPSIMADKIDEICKEIIRGKDDDTSQAGK